MTPQDARCALDRHLRETAVLASAASLLSWDQETMMPPRGGALRAEQLALLAGLVHARRTDPRLDEWMDLAADDPAVRDDPVFQADLRELRRDVDRARQLPQSLVEELAATSSRAQLAWQEARARSDYAAFRPWLERLLELLRQKADCHGARTPEARYDALLEDYEPGMRAQRLEALFGQLRPRLVALVERARGRLVPEAAWLRVPVPVAQQAALARRLLEAIGFDLAAGRLDTSAHPFCQDIGPGDTRLTTRYRTDDFLEGQGSVLHEAGHGLYEQGLPKADGFGWPHAEAVSLGIHESQSRLWENFVGRSLAFWRWWLPQLQATLGEPWTEATPAALYRALNRVHPGPIRVGADEVTYNLHIVLRFDLERALLGGDLPLEELPATWNARVRQDLGVEVRHDAEGCLQDIHWSMGAIGYFPTYTLGNLYGAQLWDAARRDLPDLEENLAHGRFAPLLAWLRERVHRWGRCYPPEELCRRATGRPLEVEPLLHYLEAKVEAVYGGARA